MNLDPKKPFVVNAIARMSPLSRGNLLRRIQQHEQHVALCLRVIPADRIRMLRAEQKRHRLALNVLSRFSAITASMEVR